MNRNEMPQADCTPGTPKQTQWGTIASSSNHTTNSVKPSAETKGLYLLRQWGYASIQSPDWLAQKDGKWVCLEVKGKELYEPGKDLPFYGIGLDKSQLYLRTQLLQGFGIRTCLLDIDPVTDEAYGAYLDDLEAKGEFYDTPKNGIRVYPIGNFSKGSEAIRKDLNGIVRKYVQ